MNLLGAALYDPAVEVVKSTAALLAMTVIDNVNLRLAIVVPAHGKVRFRMACALHGAATMAQILLGVMNGAVVLGRVAPTLTASNLAATTIYQGEAEFTVTGLAPGAMNVDAAYAVQLVVAATGIKYGGPNTNAGANSRGGFVFEAWDPQPLKLALDGGVNVTQVASTVQTARDLGLALPAAAPGAAGGLLIDDVWTDARAAKLDNLDAAVTTRLATAGYTAPPSAAVVADAVWDELIAGHLGVGSTGLQLSLVAAGGLDAAGVRAAIGLAAADLDTQLLPLPLIKAKTDSLVFTIPGKVDASLYYVNGSQITGLGTAASPWKSP